MIFTRDRSTTFFLVSAGIIALLASMAVTELKDIPLDRHHGHVVLERLPLNDPDIFRCSGTVRGSLDLIAELQSRMSYSERLLEVQAILETEYLSAESAPNRNHPKHLTILEEQQTARALRDMFPHLMSRTLSPSELHRVLSGLEADNAIAEEVESFFNMSQSHRPRADLSSTAIPLNGPDRFAANAKIRLKRLPRVERTAHLLRAANHFRTEDRPRAWIRWLLRAYGSAPDSVECCQALVNAYLANERIHEAFIVIGTTLSFFPKHVDLWRQRATLAGWLSRPYDQIIALEKLVRVDPQREEIARALRLLRWSGIPSKSLPFATDIASTTQSEEARKLCVDLALETGNVEKALDYVRDWMNLSEESLAWRERYVQICRRDLRIDEAREQLEILRVFNPGKNYESELEEIYRVTNDESRLITFLKYQLEDDPYNQNRRLELIGRLSARGHRLEALDHTALWLKHNVKPTDFFRDLPAHKEAGVPDLEPLAESKVDLLPKTLDHMRLVLNQCVGLLSPSCLFRLTDRFVRELPDTEDNWSAIIESYSREKSHSGYESSARQLHLAFPSSKSLRRCWAQYATWTEVSELELDARKSLYRSEPNLLENLARLSYLFRESGKLKEGVDFLMTVIESSDPSIALISTCATLLLRLGRYDEGFRLLERAARHPEATEDDIVRAGDRFFETEKLDYALAFYRVVLEGNPTHAHALLRSGLVHSWTNDPRGALRYLEEYVETASTLDAEILFYLGEAYLGVGETAKAKSIYTHALSIASLATNVPINIKARLLMRAGLYERAIPLYERILHDSPNDLGWILDFAEASIAHGDFERGHQLLAQAESLRTRDSRTLRLKANLAMGEERYLDARTLLQDCLAIGGENASVLADIAWSHQRDGNLRQAQESFARSKRLQPQNDSTQENDLVISDRLASILSFQSRFRWIDDDRVVTSELNGSTLVNGESTRLSGAIGFSSFRGQSIAAAGETTELVDQSALLDLSIDHRWIDNHLGFGVRSYPDFNEGSPIGLWATAHFEDSSPFQSIHFDFYQNDLLENPPAAISLGGRRDGIQVRGFKGLTEDLWTSASLAYDTLKLDPHSLDSARDGQVRGSLDLGAHFLKGPTLIEEPFRARQVPSSLQGLITKKGSHQSAPYWGAWITYTRQELLGNQELSSLIPLSNKVQSLTMTSRFDVWLGGNLATSTSAYVGRELEENQTLWGAQADLVWRFDSSWEAYFGGGFSSSVGRTDTNGSGGFARAGVTLRW